MHMERSKLLEDKFMTTARFSQEVERIVLNNKDMNYIDAIIHYCEQNEIELETVPKLISKPDLLRGDVRELSLRARLPQRYLRRGNIRRGISTKSAGVARYPGSLRF